MYRVTKPAGYSATITVENTDTYASIDIGVANVKIADILEKEGVLEVRDASSEWNFEVSKETASELVASAMKIKKPIRDQRKKPEDKPSGKIGVEVDAFDLIYGI